MGTHTSGLDLVYMHMDLNMEVSSVLSVPLLSLIREQIHFTGMFLPWHRYFVKYFEDALIYRCNYTGATPYWDWTIGAASAV